MARKKCINHPDRDVWAKNVCISCYRAMYAKKLAKISDRMKNILKAYKTLRENFLSNNPICKANLFGCTKQATEVHHSAKKQSMFDWLNVRNYVPICRSCHMRLEANPRLAQDLGFYNYKVTANEKETNTTTADNVY